MQRSPFFNQNLANWDVSAVFDMTDMFVGSALDTENYDATLESWSDQPVQTGVNFGVGNTQFSPDVLDRKNVLLDDFSWTISDGGVVD